MDLEELSCNKIFAGRQLRFMHNSAVLKCRMTFSIFLPQQTENQAVPCLYWLSGLTCSDENFVIKAGAQQYAARYGVAIVAADTSPRGKGVADDPDGAYDLGLGAGFYVNATQPPWDRHYQMYDYIVTELPQLINASFPIDSGRVSIFGHSMGGHGALTIALKNPMQYRSVSAFAPICSPVNCGWGTKALNAYLGTTKSNREYWQQYDATALIAQAKERLPLLVDQGDADEFLEQQLKPNLLRSVCEQYNYPLQLRLQAGYDHSYFFIATFIEDHIRFHANYLSA